MSTAGDVAALTVAAVQGIGLVKAGGTALDSASVVLRKVPSLPSGKEPPQVVVTVEDEGQTEYLTATTKLKKCAVAVTIISGNGQKLLDDSTVRTWRQQIEGVLDRRSTWVTLTGWSETNVTNKAPFDTGALSKDLNYSIVAAEVQVVEVRT